MAQLVERVLGKDEVSSSNLDSSSKDRTTLGTVFCFIYSSKSRVTLDTAFCFILPSSERKVAA